MYGRICLEVLGAVRGRREPGVRGIDRVAPNESAQTSAFERDTSEAAERTTDPLVGDVMGVELRIGVLGTCHRARGSHRRRRSRSGKSRSNIRRVRNPHRVA